MKFKQKTSEAQKLTVGQFLSVNVLGDDFICQPGVLIIRGINDHTEYLQNTVVPSIKMIHEHLGICT